MSEFLKPIEPKELKEPEALENPEQEQDLELMEAIGNLVIDYLSEDVEFVRDMDVEELLGYAYGALLEMGEDPDALLLEYGITEEEPEPDEI